MYSALVTTIIYDTLLTAGITKRLMRLTVDYETGDADVRDHGLCINISPQDPPCPDTTEYSKLNTIRNKFISDRF
jgi:hypothetical protein